MASRRPRNEPQGATPQREVVHVVVEFSSAVETAVLALLDHHRSSSTVPAAPYPEASEIDRQRIRKTLEIRGSAMKLSSPGTPTPTRNVRCAQHARLGVYCQMCSPLGHRKHLD